jgi:acetyl-CoA decarbonylase/synthase, CODH/ACS complex subunit gamma
MALTGLEIFKLLPKTNCKGCGQATCLAFAMALAGSKTTLDKCPHVSEEAKETLGGASAPPIKLIKIGEGDKLREIGDEVALFRHEKAFFHPTCIAVEIEDSLTSQERESKVEEINSLVFERVGQKISIDLIAVKNTSKDAEKFVETVKFVHQNGRFALVLMSEDPAAMERALEIAAPGKPLIYAANESNYEKMVALASKFACPLAVKGNGLESTAALVEKVSASYKELIIDLGTNELSKAIGEITQTRRLAIKKKFRPFGYPVIAITSSCEDPREEVLNACAYMSKYASIIIMKASSKSQILPLLSWRMNLYSDPQKPSQVEPKLYKIGNTNENSPVFATTNFSLTFYTVEAEIAASKVPSYIISCPTDGTSVLTAWAAGKFNGEKISEFLKECKIEEEVSHRKIVIPGYVAVIKGALEEKSGWEVVVGPQEASGLPAFCKKISAK